MKEIITAFFAMGLSYVIAQAIGPITTVLSIVSAQMKSITAILITELAANFLTAMSYILLGGISGSYICLTACVQTIISFVFAKKKRKVPKAITALFLVCYIAVSLLAYRTPMDILPCFCALAFALSVAQSNAKGYRFFMTISAVLWIAYDILVGAWGMLITHGLLLGSLIIAFIRQGKAAGTLSGETTVAEMLPDETHSAEPASNEAIPE